MDDDTKTFLISIKKEMNNRFNVIDSHLKKTCDEVSEIDKKVAMIEERLDNHLQVQKTIREKILVVSTLVSTTVAIAAVIMGL